MAPRIARLASSAVLQLAALVLAHQLVYLARYGSLYGEALVHTGHGDGWNAAVSTSLVLAAGLLALGVARLHWLGLLVRRASRASDAHTGPLPRRALLEAFARVAPRIALLQLVLLSVQENVEHLAAGQPAPDAAILFSPEYAGGGWIALAVSFAVSLVVALFVWRRDVLLARLRAARAALPRVSDVAPRRPGLVARRPVESVLGRRSALRAPPLLTGSA
jgi:hypothetical protein